MKSYIYLVLLLAAVIVVAVGCTKNEPVPAEKFELGEDSQGEAVENFLAEPLNLLCSCESEEEAKAIAEDYGIEFESYGYGVATFNSKKDLETLDKIAKEKKLPELSINHEVHAFDE